MTKETFQQGDYVAAIKWDGEEIMGVYEYPYIDGTHCVTNYKDNHRCCTRKGEIRKATQEEINKMRGKENELINEDELEQILVAVE